MTDRLHMDNVSVAPSGTPLLQNIQLTLGADDFIALVGPNGAGKSTLIRSALGLMETLEGRVRIGEQDVASMDGKTRASHLSWLPQQSAIYEPVTVLGFVTASRYRFNESRSAAHQASRACLARCKALSLIDRTMDPLSGGEAQRVAFAALLAQEARLSLVDEPANHLDPVNQFQLYSLLGEHWQRGHGVICITHDINLLNYVCGPDRAGAIQVWGIGQGEIRFRHGFTDSELPQSVGDLFGATVSTLERDGQTHFLWGGKQEEGPS